MLQAVSIVVLSLVAQEETSPQPKVLEKLEISCKNILQSSKPAKIETADEKAARHEADFEKALMQMDKCLNKVAVSASDAGGGGASGSRSPAGGDGMGADSASPGQPEGTEQQPSDSADTNGAPNEADIVPSRQAPPVPSTNTIPETPSDIPSKASDNVLALQLRELAEQEQDPELKKKYWNQYRKYKGLKEID